MPVQRNFVRKKCFRELVSLYDSPFWAWPSAIFVDNVPKYLIFSIKKLYLDSCNLKPYSWILEKTLWTGSLCCSTFWLFNNMSSKYATAKSRSLSIVSITSWKIVGAALTPNGRRPHLYNPWCMLILSNLEHSPSPYLKIRVTDINFWK